MSLSTECRYCGLVALCKCRQPEPLDERRAFLRAAALAMRVARWHSGQVLPVEACWREARELWEAKPEDC